MLTPLPNEASSTRSERNTSACRHGCSTSRTRHCSWGPAHVDEVTGRARRRSTWARENGNRYLEADMLGYSLGVGDAMRDASTRPAEQIVEAKAILEDLGLRLWRGHVSNAAGYVEWLAGDLSAAERELREGNELLDEDGRPIRHPQCNAARAGAVPSRTVGTKPRTGAR